tara:strand:+ start:1015 stop:1185 length:171 start_codon:yes stop_codon:yes gene_type:complete
MNGIFSTLVVTFHSLNMYDILIIQDTNGELLSIKIEEYESERTKAPKYFQNDENIH